MAKGAEWEKIGELRKTRRADMLVGEVEIKDLNVKLRVVAFIRTNEQKRSNKEADIVLLLPNDKQKIEVSDNFFD